MENQKRVSRRNRWNKNQRVSRKFKRLVSFAPSIPEHMTWPEVVLLGAIVGSALGAIIYQAVMAISKGS